MRKCHKVRFCKGKHKTPDTVFKEDAPLINRRKAQNATYIIYVPARAQYVVYEAVCVLKRNLIRRHKKWQ